MNVLETEWWTMALAPEWWAEAEEDTICVGDYDDVGCIEISTLCKDQGEFNIAAVHDIAAAESQEVNDWQTRTLGEFDGICGTVSEEGMAIREWYVIRGKLLLFITYSCEQENKGMDDAAVDELLGTLMIVDPA